MEKSGEKKEKRLDVAALGELLIDFTENGVNEEGNPVLTANPGGAPCNVLAMLQNLGRKTAFIGKVGKDAFGDFLEKTISELGIDTSNLVKDETVPTTLAFVHTAADGDRSFSFYRNPGADMMLKEEEINYSLIDQARVFHFGTLSMTDKGCREATEAAVLRAKSKGLLISFDPNLRPPLWKDLQDSKAAMDYGIRQCDILKIADNEICFLTGKDTVEEAIPAFLKTYAPRLTCVTLGKDGSIALYEGMQVESPGFLREDTIETTGAGDCFMAYMIHYVLEDGLEKLSEEDLQKMQDFAGRAASLITTRKGALKVMPKKEELI